MLLCLTSSHLENWDSVLKRHTDANMKTLKGNTVTVLPAKSDSDVKFCLQHYQGLIIDISLLY